MLTLCYSTKSCAILHQNGTAFVCQFAPFYFELDIKTEKYERIMQDSQCFSKVVNCVPVQEWKPWKELLLHCESATSEYNSRQCNGQKRHDLERGVVLHGSCNVVYN